ncbi:ABC transporter substrate-binding protein [Chelatococcus sp. SYSU_G07232]|uniref:ABC transporter substrate-binding protein n=1 Tax=Chelatococcus albus TaxID=3047466 RepID=A0ABT7ABE6_9HYPH|nr:ABC transporter substrate-binding protein [Chelatococcus sp. SYSU_G07232]MDJ1156679.1 ABC transporter substrate-binding protein [Chelatococcus sp. SYSU_G07232]
MPRLLPAFAGLLLLAAAALPAAGQDAAPRARRIVALDWGLAETLIALGIPPIGVPETRSYADWVVAPPLPAGVAEVGLRLEPNPEILQQLAPDLILTIAEHEAIRPLLARIAPTLALPIYGPEGRPYDRAVAATGRLARLTGREAQGEALIATAETVMARARARFAGSGDGRSVYVVSFLDGRHVRVYGKGGLFQDVLDRLGLRNAWQGETNGWGFATIGIERLADDPDASLIVLEPLPHDAQRTFRGSRLWRNLPFVRAGRVHRLPPVLMFGTLPAAVRFAELLTATLLGEAPHE